MREWGCGAATGGVASGGGGGALDEFTLSAAAPAPAGAGARMSLGSESHFRKITIKARSKRMKAACEWSVFRG